MPDAAPPKTRPWVPRPAVAALAILATTVFAVGLNRSAEEVPPPCPAPFETLESGSCLALPPAAETIIVYLHGMTATSELAREEASSLARRAIERNIGVLAPLGIRGACTWDPRLADRWCWPIAADAVEQTKAVETKIQADMATAFERRQSWSVVMAGFSNGGFMAMRLASLPPGFSGLVVVQGGVPPALSLDEMSPQPILLRAARGDDRQYPTMQALRNSLSSTGFGPEWQERDGPHAFQADDMEAVISFAEHLPTPAVFVTDDDDAVPVHLGEQNRRGTTKADHIPAYRARFDRDPTPENGFLLARLLPAAESEALVLRLLADHPYDPWLLRLGARHHLRARRWSEAVRAYEKLVQISPLDIGNSFELRATALAGAGRAEEALWLADRLPLVPHARSKVALTYARLAQLVGGRNPSGYLERVSRREPLPQGFLASFQVLTGGDGEAEIAAVAGAHERAARRVEREALRDPQSALALLAQAPEGTAGELDLDVAVLLLGAAERAKLSAVRDELVSALEEHGPPFLDYIRTGRENTGTDDLPPAGLAAIHVARAWTLGGSERDALLSLARQEDPLRGVPSLAAERWFASATDRHSIEHR